MKVNFVGKDLIKKYEGCRLEAYKCPAGIWTIGYGHTGQDVFEGKTITQQEADNLLSKDLTRFEKFLNRVIKVPVNQNQFNALASFTYNVGMGALQNSTLLKKLNNNDLIGAANEFDRWVYANGKKLEGLIKRRKAEKELFLS